MTHIQNSAFKTKAGIVPDVSKILPEPGAFTISEHDGNLYYADDYGWHQAEQPYSPITLFVDFNGTDQFEFSFYAPLGSTLEIHQGDGVVAEEQGADATRVTYTTTYSEAGIYYFTVGGDVADITGIRTVGYYVYGDIKTMLHLDNMDFYQCNNSSMYGDITGFYIYPAMETFNTLNANVWGSMDRFGVWKDLRVIGLGSIIATNPNITGDIANLLGNPTAAFFSIYNCTNLRGDVSDFDFPAMTSLEITGCPHITFNRVVLWDRSSTINLSNNKFTPTMVDNALMSFVNLTGATINLGGNNASRTCKSSEALLALAAAGNTVTVNDKGTCLPVYRYNGIDNYHFNDVDDFLIGNASGSIKARFYYDGVNSTMIFASSTILDNSHLIIIECVSSTNKIVFQFTNTTDVASRIFGRIENELSAGWYTVELVSNGSSHTFYINGVEQTIFTVVGTAFGMWFNGVPNRVNISIGALIDDTPNFVTGAVQWLQIDDGANGDWHYDAASNSFIDRSVHGLNLTPVGTWP